MADELKIPARELVKALEAAKLAIEKYAAAAMAVGNAAPDGASFRGLDRRQVQRLVKEHVIARLSTKRVVGGPGPILELEGAPEARRFIVAHPLPGLV